LPLASQQRRWKPSSSANDGPPTARYDLQLLPSQVDRTSLEHPCESFWLLARLEVSRRTIGRRAEKRVSCTLSVEARAAANPMGERDAVARRGGAVRRGVPNGGPALLAGQANRGRDCGCSDRTADSRSGASRMTQGVVDLARYWNFESVSLQQTVRLSRDFSLRHRKAGSCRGVRGPGQAAPPAETPGARQHHANCR